MDSHFQRGKGASSVKTPSVKTPSVKTPSVKKLRIIKIRRKNKLTFPEILKKIDLESIFSIIQHHQTTNNITERTIIKNRENELKRKRKKEKWKQLSTKNPKPEWILCLN
jgi:hypothetical protein